MLAATKAETQLRLPPRGAKDSVPLREYLETLEERSGKRDDRLDDADVPEGLEYLWATFWIIFQGSPLSFTEMRAWSEMTKTPLTPWEAETLRAMSLVAAREASSA